MPNCGCRSRTAVLGASNPGGRGRPAAPKGWGRQQTPRERPQEAPASRLPGAMEHALESCPQCGTDLSGGWAQRTREVIDIPAVPAQVTEHVFIARTCPVCEKRRVPKSDLGGAALGKQRLGVNLLSLAALREEGRLPLRAIQWYLKTSVVAPGRHRGGHPSVPARPSRRWTGCWSASAPARWSTPTRPAGGRMANGCLDFQHSHRALLPAPGRNKEVVDEALGDSFGGVLVSDFYAAYHHYDGPKQRCWVHLLRDIHDLKSLHPRQCRTSTGRPKPSPILMAANGDWPKGVRAEAAGPVPSLPEGSDGGSGQAVPANRTAHQGTVRLRG